MAENRDIPYVLRRREAEIAAFLGDRTRHKNVLLVEGARQVGKTRLVEHALGDVAAPTVHLNLERDRRARSEIDACGEFQEFEQLLEDRFGFQGAAGHVLFIDEAQESSRLGRYVRFMKEEWSHASVILSGSSLTRLFRPGIRYPVGRVKRMVLGPLCFSEYLRARGQDHLAQAVAAGGGTVSPIRHQHLLEHLDSFLMTGGLPAVVLRPAGEQGAPEMLADIFADYEEDFRRISGEQTAHLAKACLRSVANHLGNVSKNTSVIPAASGSQSNRISEAALTHE